jgi:transcriptional regulator with XRE-family HTH domain
MGSGGVRGLSPERMRRARTRAGLSYRQLAALVGVSATTLYRYEAGLVSPRPPRLQALADALGCTTEYLAPLPRRPTLRDHREHAGLLLHDLAERLDVADSTVIRMEDGSHWPDDPERWAAAYGLTIKAFAEAWRPPR